MVEPVDPSQGGELYSLDVFPRALLTDPRREDEDGSSPRWRTSNVSYQQHLLNALGQPAQPVRAKTNDQVDLAAMHAIAILPFTNMSTNDETGFFAEGLSEWIHAMISIIESGGGAGGGPPCAPALAACWSRSCTSGPSGRRAGCPGRGSVLACLPRTNPSSGPTSRHAC